MALKLSEYGLNLVKHQVGLCLQASQPGYGLSATGVRSGNVINETQVEAFLCKDIADLEQILICW